MSGNSRIQITDPEMIPLASRSSGNGQPDVGKSGAEQRSHDVNPETIGVVALLLLAAGQVTATGLPYLIEYNADTRRV